MHCDDFLTHLLSTQFSDNTQMLASCSKFLTWICQSLPSIVLSSFHQFLVELRTLSNFEIQLHFVGNNVQVQIWLPCHRELRCFFRKPFANCYYKACFHVVDNLACEKFISIPNSFSLKCDNIEESVTPWSKLFDTQYVPNSIRKWFNRREQSSSMASFGSFPL